MSTAGWIALAALAVVAWTGLVTRGYGDRRVYVFWIALAVFVVSTLIAIGQGLCRWLS